MRIEDKLDILANAAKYDVSCASSGSRRKNAGGPGNASPSGICHTHTDDGRCVSFRFNLIDFLWFPGSAGPDCRHPDTD
jgi:predicted DNA-binding helix-hairpin-helix protein